MFFRRFFNESGAVPALAMMMIVAIGVGGIPLSFMTNDLTFQYLNTISVNNASWQNKIPFTLRLTYSNWATGDSEIFIMGADQKKKKLECSNVSENEKNCSSDEKGVGYTESDTINYKITNHPFSVILNSRRGSRELICTVSPGDFSNKICGEISN